MRKAFTFIKWSAFGILMLVLTLFIAVMWSVEGPEKSNRNTAIVACMSAIEASLKNPDSVDWVSRLDWPSSFDDPTWTIQATYRATNGFGAVVTEVVTCEAPDGSFSANLIR